MGFVEKREVAARLKGKVGVFFHDGMIGRM